MIDTKRIQKVAKALKGVEEYVVSINMGDNEIVTITKNMEEEAMMNIPTDREQIGFRG